MFEVLVKPFTFELNIAANFQNFNSISMLYFNYFTNKFIENLEKENKFRHADN